VKGSDKAADCPVPVPDDLSVPPPGVEPPLSLGNGFCVPPNGLFVPFPVPGFALGVAGCDARILAQSIAASTARDVPERGKTSVSIEAITLMVRPV